MDKTIKYNLCRVNRFWKPWETESILIFISIFSSSSSPNAKKMCGFRMANIASDKVCNLTQSTIH